MTAARKLQHVSVEDYLAGELDSQVKHEYLGGFVYAMAGARNVHNLIAGNVFGTLFSKLRGKPCRPYNSDTKVRVKLPTHIRFYYPDVMVICESNSPDDSFQDQPAVIVEVLSEKTRRIDQGEKKDAYLMIPTLQFYLLIEQDCAMITAYRRTNEGFVREVYEELSSIIPLGEMGAELALSEVYEGVDFVPESVEEEI